MGNPGLPWRNGLPRGGLAWYVGSRSVWQDGAPVQPVFPGGAVGEGRLQVKATMILGAALGAALHSATATAGLIGISWGGNVFNIDPATGQAAAIGYSGRFDFNSMAKSASGQLYSQSRSTTRLLRINPDTGQATTTDYNSNYGDIRAMAFAPASDTQLYVIDGGGSSISKLYLFDLSTTTNNDTTRKLIGLTDGYGVQGMTFGANGVLYGWVVDVGLVTIDPETAHVTILNPNRTGADIQTLFLSPDGRLFGARDALYEIDPASGATTYIVSMGDGTLDIRGMEFIPTPASALVFGTAIIWARRRR